MTLPSKIKEKHRILPLIVQAASDMTSAEKIALADWEKVNVTGSGETGTSDWPGWKVILDRVFWNQRAPLLGTKPDRELATLWGVAIAQVKKHRERHGIAACKPSYEPSPVTWTAEQDAMLGTMPDTETAIALGGIDPESVKARRKELGIISFADKISVQKKERDDRTFDNMQWPAELVAELGKRFDHYLADKFDIPEWMVSRKRISLGIKEEPYSHLH